MQRTLGIIKPGPVKRSTAGEIISAIERAPGLRIAGIKWTTLDRPTVETFYAEHRGKSFFEGLVEHMTSGPSCILILEGEDAVQRWRDEVGPTDPQKNTYDRSDLRSIFGLCLPDNGLHASDSVASAEREIALFFPDQMAVGATDFTLNYPVVSEQPDDKLVDQALIDALTGKVEPSSLGTITVVNASHFGPVPFWQRPFWNDPQFQLPSPGLEIAKYEPTVKWKRLHPDAKLPKRASSGSAGYDLYSVEDVVLLPAKEITSTAVYDTTLFKEPPVSPVYKVSLGFAAALPKGWEGQVRTRSGMATKGIQVANSPGTIDSDFLGGWCVLLINHSDVPFVIQKGDRIAQLVLSRYETSNFKEVESLDATERGEGGFGSSGK